MGRKIKRLRELKGIKQEVLASALGESQQSVSNLEKRETIDGQKLDKIARVFQMSPEEIQEFSEEAMSLPAAGHSPEALPKIIELYERLLEAEKEKYNLLELASAPPVLI